METHFWGNWKSIFQCQHQQPSMRTWFLKSKLPKHQEFKSIFYNLHSWLGRVKNKMRNLQRTFPRDNFLADKLKSDVRGVWLLVSSLPLSSHEESPRCNANKSSNPYSRSSNLDWAGARMKNLNNLHFTNIWSWETKWGQGLGSVVSSFPFVQAGSSGAIKMQCHQFKFIHILNTGLMLTNVWLNCT